MRTLSTALTAAFLATVSLGAANAQSIDGTNDGYSAAMESLRFSDAPKSFGEAPARSNTSYESRSYGLQVVEPQRSSERADTAPDFNDETPPSYQPTAEVEIPARR